MKSRKYILVLAILALFLLIPKLNVKADFHLYYVNTATNMTTTAGGSQVVTALNPGDIVVLVSFGGKYSKISVGDLEGYVQSKYLQVEDLNYVGEAHGVDGNLLSNPSAAMSVDNSVKETNESVDKETEESGEETEETEEVEEESEESIAIVQPIPVQETFVIEKKDTELNNQLDDIADEGEAITAEQARQEKAKKKSTMFKIIIGVLIVAIVGISVFEALKKQKEAAEKTTETPETKVSPDKTPETSETKDKPDETTK